MKYTARYCLLGLLFSGAVHSPIVWGADKFTLGGVYTDSQAARNAVNNMAIDSSSSGGYCCGHHREGQKAYYLHGRLGDNSVSYYAYYYDDGAKECPSGTVRYSDGSCHPESTLGKPKACAGNPINLANGEKFQTELDYQDHKSPGLNFIRYYSSVTGKWRHSFSSEVQKQGTSDGQYDFWVSRVSSFGQRGYSLIRGNSVDGIYYESVSPDGGRYSSAVNGSDITYEDEESGEIYTYTDAGYTVKNPQTGSLITVEHTGRHTWATDRFGRSVSIEHDTEGRLVDFTGVDGIKLTYQYAEGNLTHLNRGSEVLRQYHYDDQRFPNALTGITDESGIRYATWAYNNAGQAIFSAHANGADEYQIVYAPDASAEVINPLGKKTIYHFQEIAGAPRVVAVEGHLSANCLGANSSYTYDAEGRTDTVTDWNGQVTDYDYNARNLEVRRVEAKGTSEERIFTTQWHPTYRLPLRISGPNETTEFIYDSDGQLQEIRTFSSISDG